MNQPAPEKLAQLRQALEAYENGAAGGGLFDREAEEAKAKVRSRALGLWISVLGPGKSSMIV